MILMFGWHWRECDEVIPELPQGFRGVLGELFDPLDNEVGGYTVDVWEWSAPADRWVKTVVGPTPADAAVMASEWCRTLDGGAVCY